MADSRHLQIILDVKNRAEKELKGVSGQLRQMEPELKQIAVASGIAFAGITALSVGAIKSASNLEESVNAVNVVFKEGAKEVLEFGKNSAKAVGLAQAEFNQMSAVTGALFADMGLPMEQVARLTNELAVRSADMASVMNTDVKDAMSAVNQAIRGETEAIRRYAGDVSDATLEQYLLAQGISKSVTELSQQEKRLYRVQLLLDQTNKFAGDFANTSDSLANQQRILKAEFTNISATMGNSLIPVANSLLSTIKPLVVSFAEFTQEHPELIKNVTVTTAVVTGLTGTFATFGILIPKLVVKVKILIESLRILGLTSKMALGIVATATVAMATLIINATNKVKKVYAQLEETQKKTSDTQLALVKSRIDRVAEAEKTGNETLIELAKAQKDKARALVENANQEEIMSINKRVEDAQKALEKDAGNVQKWSEIVSKTSVKTASAVESGIGDIDFSSLIGSLDDVSKSTDETSDSLSDLTKEYRDFSKDAQDYVFELSEAHTSSLKRFKEQISGIKASMSQLSSSFAQEEKSDRMKLAGDVVTTQDEVAKLETEIARTSSVARRNELQQELDSKRASLLENSELIKGLENEIAETRRRNSLTDLQRSIEDYNHRRQLAQNEFNARMSDLKQELKAIKEQRDEEKKLYKAKVEFISQQEEELKQRHISNLTGNLASTKEAIQEEISYYKSLAEAISAVRGSSTLNAFNRATSGSVGRSIFTPNDNYRAINIDLNLDGREVSSIVLDNLMGDLNKNVKLTQ